MTTYTTKGSVRGSCGHNHRTISAACKCAAEDMAACQKQGGYSDRSVCRTDGEELDEGEIAELIAMQDVITFGR